MHAGFLVNRNPVRAGVSELRNKQIGIFDHQVTVDWNLNYLAKRSHDRWSNCDVRNEMAVHHVHVQNGSAALDRL
jgi:hypothetical protein